MLVKYETKFFFLVSFYITLFALTTIITNDVFTQIPKLYGETLYDIANRTIPNQGAHISITNPHHMVLAGTKLYVANFYDNSVYVVDYITDKIVANIKVGNNPTAIAIDPYIGKVLVSNLNNESVSVIDENNYTNIATVQLDYFLQLF
jgi:YVTN family beta-propeller protein